jgi:hypothetical protein
MCSFPDRVCYFFSQSTFAANNLIPECFMKWNNFWGTGRGTSLESHELILWQGKTRQSLNGPSLCLYCPKVQVIEFLCGVNWIMVSLWGSFIDCVFEYFHELRNIYEWLCGYNATCVNVHLGIAIHDFNSMIASDKDSGSR